ncbi:MAG: NUDIX hydrolase [Erysipelotrichaceae bacterium]|jgi:ADP-ribose pyrophosphatase YjhB (NUDIX family)|nr:NUDIX hydrolase [Bacillota bacterium]NLL26778.1 NUDIX hydrolase [Erysipelotrichia bacterium]
MKNKLICQIKEYKPFNEQEKVDKDIILSYLKDYDDIFYRTNLIAHMTASGWVLNKNKDKLLMAYHNLYDSWAWLGGHADGQQDLLEVAIKEVKEESGLEVVEALSEDIYSLEILSVDGHFKNGEYVPTHVHLNITYLLQADETETIVNKEDENSEVGWFELKKAVEVSNEKWFRENIYSKLNEKLKLLK